MLVMDQVTHQHYFCFYWVCLQQYCVFFHSKLFKACFHEKYNRQSKRTEK